MYDRCQHNTRQFHPSCTVCRRTANLARPQSHPSNQFHYHWCQYNWTVNINNNNNKYVSVLTNDINTHFRFTIKRCSSFIYCKACDTKVTFIYNTFKWCGIFNLLQGRKEMFNLIRSFRLVTRDLLYALSYRQQDSTHRGICYASRGALTGTNNSSMGPPWGIDSLTHHITSGHPTTELHLAFN